MKRFLIGLISVSLLFGVAQTKVKAEGEAKCFPSSLRASLQTRFLAGEGAPIFTCKDGLLRQVGTLQRMQVVEQTGNWQMRSAKCLAWVPVRFVASNGKAQTGLICERNLFRDKP